MAINWRLQMGIFSCLQSAIQPLAVTKSYILDLYIYLVSKY